MNRTLAITLFLLLASAIAVGIHRYLWLRLGRDLGRDFCLPTWWSRTVAVLLTGLCLLLFAGPMASRTLGGEAANLGAAGAFSWLGILFLFVMAFATLDLLRWLGGRGRRLLSARQPSTEMRPSTASALDTAIDPERRLFFQRALSGGAATGAVLASSAGIHSAINPPAITQVEVVLDRLPAQLDGFRIVQISDLHVSATIRRPYVQAVVDLANSCKADLVALTGDLMDGSVPMLREEIAPIAGLKSTHGSYFCTGNHEYYSGVEPWLVELRRLGVTVLRNERVAIPADAGNPSGAVAGTENPATGFDLVGIDDYHAARFGHGHGADLSKAMSGRDATRAVVLLAHQPRAIDEATRHGVDLVLSGHTHGGQIWPFGYLVRFVQPYVSGLHRHRIGQQSTQIYVSRGTGYWGPPMRIGAQHEVTLITLRAALAEV